MFFAHLLCKHWVGTMSRIRDYVMYEVELVQDERLWLRSIQIFIYLF